MNHCRINTAQCVFYSIRLNTCLLSSMFVKCSLKCLSVSLCVSLWECVPCMEVNLSRTLSCLWSNAFKKSHKTTWSICKIASYNICVRLCIDSISINIHSILMYFVYRTKYSTSSSLTTINARCNSHLHKNTAHDVTQTQSSIFNSLTSTSTQSWTT